MIRLFSQITKKSIVKLTLRMSSSNQSNRLSSFGTNEEDPIYEATVHSIQNLSPSIKQFYLLINDPLKTFHFQSGMFLDFYLPSTITSIITGFSICNSPLNYSQTNLIELAIRETDYPPTKHMFNDCQVNENIRVKPGGDFFYHSNITKNDSLLLICAGIGANPIVSILRHILDLYHSNNSQVIPHRVEFFYTAATKEDLVFHHSIDLSCQQMIKDNILRTNYFVTREINDSIMNNRRINKEDLYQAIQRLEKPVTAYLCGPPLFIDWTENSLKELNVKNIFYEKWW
jgi:ferredoxin-NADP reductase